MKQQLCHTSEILAVAAGRGGNGLRYWRIKTKGPSVCETIFGGCPVLEVLITKVCEVPSLQWMYKEMNKA